MDVSSLTIAQMVEHKLAYHGQRQNILAQNVANANTPGYIPKDLKPVDFKGMARKNTKHIGLTTTHQAHMNITRKVDFRADQSRFERTPVGNEVVIEEQMMKLDRNAAEYQKSLNIYRKMLAMMQVAVGKSE